MTARLSPQMVDMLAALDRDPVGRVPVGWDGWPVGTARALERRGLVRLTVGKRSHRSLFATVDTYRTEGTATLTEAGRAALEEVTR